jgi:RNA polymerase sigma-70 factor (ECF subfamily)
VKPADLAPDEAPDESEFGERSSESRALGRELREGPDSGIDLDAVYRTNVRFAWRLVANMGVRPDDIADVVQEVFVVVHRRLGTVTLRSSLRAWIYGICVRCCANYRRRAVTRRERLVSEPPETVANDDERLSARLDLKRALQLLDNQQRAIFLLYEVEGLSMSEVAEALSTPLSTAYSRLHAARETVQREFRKGHEKQHEQGFVTWTNNRRD